MDDKNATVRSIEKLYMHIYSAHESTLFPDLMFHFFYVYIFLCFISFILLKLTLCPFAVILDKVISFFDILL